MTSELGILYSPTDSSLQNKFDHIIIGSGLGGLICAAKLALNGKKVIVLEQHFQAGGCATTFKRGKDVYEVALHEMDLGDKKTDGKHRIFKELGIDKTQPLCHLTQSGIQQIKRITILYLMVQIMQEII
uniref:FAD binding domain-containing protein n=1 Tax=Spironucleus salmonicida TaxID=348837 RepID=V6LUE5_9EUKA|eukprot:EST47883.1 FAD binding domain-containing protein [Spironucleus salmonicida]